MKRKTGAWLLSAVMTFSCLSGMPGFAAGNVYELENGKITGSGENASAAVSLNGASSGKAVHLTNAGDKVSVEVQSAGGSQVLTFRYSQPYDENGKYQNVLVNGTNIGQILCAYTGEGKFRTVSIPATLKNGKNTITVESSWGWTYLDSMTVGAAQTSSAANPIISRGVPAHANNGKAASGNDSYYYTTWDAKIGSYLAYDLSSVPEAQRSRVIAVWYNNGAFDSIDGEVYKSDKPVDYTIEVNSAPGGSYPSDGWKAAETVKGNTLSTRQHVVDMAGCNWIRIRVTKAEDQNVSLNFDIHSAANGVQDSWMFFGDSITAGSMVNAWGTGFATHVNALDSRFFPVQQNGGIGGLTSWVGAAHIDEWLKGCPAKYVSIAYGTNDAWNNPNNLDRYYKSTKYMIDAVLREGKIPILPTIPYASDGSAGKYTADYNAKVSQLYKEYGDKLLHGPDFYVFFKSNPGLLSQDGVHPSGDGYEAMRKLWAETMYETVYKNAASDPAPEIAAMEGDINLDGSFDKQDVVTLQKWLLKDDSSAPAAWQAGDLNGDGTLTAADLTLMKRLLMTEKTPDPPPQQHQEEYSAFYEAEKAMLSGGLKASFEAGASGGQVVGDFSGASDKLSFRVSVPSDGVYSLNIRSKGLGGDKVNDIQVDGEGIGNFTSTGNQYTTSVVRSVLMTAGEHTITFTRSWGWIMVDSLEVKTDEMLSNSIYDVSDQLIDAKANANTRAVFSYLCETYGKYMLTGQVCDYGFDGPEFKAIHDVTGKYPAICGLDFMNYATALTARGARGEAVDTALKIHKAGGLVEFCWHWSAPAKYVKDGNDAHGNPCWWQGFSTSNVTIDIGAIMNGRDPEGKRLIDADIAAVAKQMHILEDAGATILWRPLHEASGGWFWWGAKGPDAYKKFWYYLYDQFTNVHNCHNLIWVWNGQSPDWYPGDNYVDIVGEDVYAGERNYAPQNAKFTEIAEYTGGKKIIAMTENGTIPDIDRMRAANTMWAWIGTWCGDFCVRNGVYNEQYTDREMLKKTYNSEYVITLDELPWYKK